MRKPIDMLGQKCGRLTVLGPAGVDSHRRALWRCLCDCGKETTAAGHDLRRGDTLSCGCLRADLARTAVLRTQRCAVDAKFGRLTLVDRVGRNAAGNMVWRCACECGGVKDVASAELRRGRVRSCGCLRRERAAVNLPPKPKREPKPKAEKAPKPVKVKAEKPKATRVRAADRKPAQQIGAWPKTAARKTLPADNRPAWRPQTDYKPLTPPAQRATGRVTVCPAPKFNHRYGVDPNKVTPMFSALKPGQYLEVAA